MLLTVKNVRDLVEFLAHVHIGVKVGLSFSF